MSDGLCQVGMILRLVDGTESLRDWDSCTPALLISSGKVKRVVRAMKRSKSQLVLPEQPDWLSSLRWGCLIG